jgi:hypothetical protein
MGRLKIYGGNFAKGRAWFTPRAGFVLRDKDGKQESISVEALAVAGRATEESILALGGDEALVDELERVPPSDKIGGQRVFIASFDDGRLLLASASLRSYRRSTPHTDRCTRSSPSRMRTPRSGDTRSPDKALLLDS